ncbi:potassium-transporting ATPase subunit KdpA, partial [Saccharothrix sp. MB29]|nr:potassium-transporting ATPase subunit KdpA [Saccharothrix sp. MB29]
PGQQRREQRTGGGHGAIVLVAALTFVPALALGPIAEALL